MRARGCKFKCAWIKVEQLKPYHAHKEEMIKINKGKRFQQAVDAVEEFLRRAKGKDQTSSHTSADDKNRRNSSEERSRPNSGDEKRKLSLSEGKVKKNMGEGKKRVTSGSTERGSKCLKRAQEQSPRKRGRPPKDEKDLTIPESSTVKGMMAGPMAAFKWQPTASEPVKDADPHFHHFLLSQTEKETGSTSIQAADSTAVNGSITPTDKKIGFLGLGLMGSGIVSNLLKMGHTVTVWNRTAEKVSIKGEVGNAAKMMLIVNMVQGSFMATIAEGLTLAQVTGQSQQTLLDILNQGQLASIFLDQKCQNILQGNFKPDFYLKYIQKDLRLAIALGDAVNHPTPMAAAANEDVNLKMPRNNQLLHFAFREDKQWKLQQIQDARNHVSQAIYLLANRDESYQFKTGAEVLKLMDAVMLQLTRARNRLTTPATLTLPEIAASGLTRMFAPTLPSDLLVNVYINLNKLCLTVYQLHALQPTSTKNFRPSGGAVLHSPGAMFEWGSQRLEVSHVHKVECVIPWLNDALVYFTVSLQLCQQLKDKISVFSSYWSSRPF
ncbi:putative oxidoreductase GLYR1 isoform 2 [Cricetulus griseus]|nr:putative oxidoreductase GLYR1 isoform 2 [Cricetulus griseus]